ncbi:MAG: exonuclease domain-containing protein [Chloroflexota bacterium]|nr:exonuclease domain-containing protein [Chloroflexota bacterium]
MPYISLDLETTGLDPEVDEIIEVAAIRFDASGVLDTYHSFVNPDRKLEFRIALLTHISAEELERAPHFGSIAPELERFIGVDPIVGQNPTFDTGFLARKGVQVFGPTFDTFDLASLLLPGLRQYSLGAIADHLGLEFTNRHRADADADAAMRVFAALRQRLAESPRDLLAEVDRIAAASDWPLRHLLHETAVENPHHPGDGDREGVVHRFVKAPVFIDEPPAPVRRRVTVAPDEAAALITSGVARATIAEFEQRPEQSSMARAVAEAIAEGDQLIVEAGTGVGKSLAYLVPSALHAVRNNVRVVISTNTINLQEQLTGQDIPIARRLLAEAGIAADDLRVAQLKGRRNYLCLLRWSGTTHAANVSSEEARVLIQLLFWLGYTDTGDRAELNLRREEDAAWNRISAQDGGCLTMQCQYVRDGSCFLLRAKKRAEAAHLLVVNHALLLSDVRTDGNVLPEYQHLVVDEAHHLEDEATSQFGFTASETEVMAWVERLHTRASRDRDGGLVGTVFAATRVAQQAIGPAPQLQAAARALTQATARVRDQVPAFFRGLQEFGRQQASGRNDYDERIQINRAMRVQPDWSDIETAWSETESVISEALGIIEQLHAMFTDISAEDIFDRDAVTAEAADLYDEGEKLRSGLARIIEKDDRETICWLTMSRRDASPALASAPLSVGETLRAGLFAPRESVVLTSATLSTEDSFDYIKGRIGAEDARELLLGSPFDYRASTLILAPSDMPEPNQQGYLSALQSSIIELVRASEGRALVLFTSHSGLRAAYQGIKRQLEEQEILVLGQGIDGAPRQLLSTLKQSHRTVILGAASFWEGVDVTGEALSLLIMARLPFSVPSDPVFQARSELFDQPFEQYALPQAILRFKQGFGRLIRRKTDRGVMVVLDRRLRSKRYGDAFLRSLPPCELREVPLRDLAGETETWLSRPAAVVDA